MGYIAFSEADGSGRTKYSSSPLMPHSVGSLCTVSLTLIRLMMSRVFTVHAYR